MEILQSVVFTLTSSWKVARKLLIFYLCLNTILALTFIIDLLSYKEVIDTINGSATLLGMTLYGVLTVLFFYFILYKVLEGLANYIWNLLDVELALHLNGI